MANPVQKTAGAYAENPWMRYLVSFVPGGGNLDVALTAAWTDIQKQRAEAFFDALRRNCAIIPERLLNSEDFFHCCEITARSAAQTRQREKIRLFANPLAAGVTEKPPVSFQTEYEELLQILDELSFREIRLLTTMAAFEARFPRQSQENDLGRCNRYWSDLKRQACAELGIQEELFSGILTRLNRTGLYETIVGAYYDYTGERGKLTGLYYRLADVLQLEAESTGWRSGS
ncbi:MAG: hypothetical protein NTW87_07870 [Planctomycetota bacterium]|nr:hypothetical protein [Planctomycetota bacterium]